MSQEKPLILIVDDMPKNIQVLGTILREKEYNIAVATNGIDATKIAEKTIPDLILLDIMMPQMDGYEACKILKSKKETKNIPVIFLTAKNEIEDKIKGFDLGAVDYVTKPFNIPELLARVNTHLELKFNRESIVELNKLNKKESNERKELIHVLCHDLSNHFHSLISVFDMVEQTGMEFTDELQMEVKKVVQNGINTIDLVRKMRSIDDKKTTLELTPVNLLYAAHSSLGILENKLIKKNINIDINIENSLHIIAEETSLINSVISNILTNAIKFSFNDANISISAKEEDEKVVFSVKDSGIGMPNDLLNSIFDANKATSRRGTNGESGTGYGMPLVQKFAKAYGGDIKVISKEKKESSNDHGTEIIITLDKAKL